jgi:hypothetical protein
MRLLILCGSLLLAAGAPARVADDVVLDFTKPELPADWSLSSKAWKVDAGELRGEGPGWLEHARPLPASFTLTFDAWTEEKANVEVKLLDAKGERDVYTFAFLGRYHSTLDGVKSAILKADAFVSVNPRMWIFPGRMFRFEVRRARNQFQMFLNGELGPVYVDEDPPTEADELRLRILFAPEGKKDRVRIDNVRVAGKR